MDIRQVKIVKTNRGLISLIFHYKDILLCFRDTYLHMSSSLKKLCKTFQTEEQKMDYDILSIKKHNYLLHLDSVYTYLKKDVMSLGEVVLGLHKVYMNFGIHLDEVLTSSAFSLKCIQKQGFTAQVVRNDTYREFVRSCLYGGRTQHIISKFNDNLCAILNFASRWKKACVDDCMHLVRVKEVSY